MENINPIINENMAITVEKTDDQIIVHFKGSIDMAEPGEILDPFFEKLHDLIRTNNIKQVTANFHQLEYLNSSGIKSFIKWIGKIPALEEAKRYCIDLIYNPEITWQEASFNVFSLIIPEYISIKSQRPPGYGSTVT